MTKLIQRPGAARLLLLSAVAGLLLLPTTAGLAQGPHPVSVGADYAYVRSNILPGCNCVSLQGGGAEVQFGLNRHLSLLGDFTGTHAGGLTPDGYDLTQLTYTFGARYHFLRPAARLRPFGEISLGGAHASGTLSPAQTGFGGANAFAFEPGGGLDVRLGHRLTLVPIRADYLLTTFANGQNGRQNDLRLSAGLRFRITH